MLSTVTASLTFALLLLCLSLKWRTAAAEPGAVHRKLSAQTEGMSEIKQTRGDVTGT